MIRLDVDGLHFAFPVDWMASKYDEWAFYRKQFMRVREGLKAVDIVAVDPQGNAWFIEVKDYRRQIRTKTTDLADEVSGKVCDTLAALLPARTNANDAAEREYAKALLKQHRIRVVLHLEQPAKPSTLFPRGIDPANVLIKLKTRLRPIDAHPLVVESTRMGSLKWQVR